jgi:CDP-glycerol glycerophosphotransferase
MQNVIRRWAKRVVKYRSNLPAPVYNGIRLAYRKLRASRYLRIPDEFDSAFYMQTNPHIDHSKLTPYVHFIQHGHKDLRNPSADFDIVWYLQNYGHTFNIDRIDPFSHFLKTGKAKGYSPRPPHQVQFNLTKSRPLVASSRRACLFAGYDPDGRIDEYVLVYLKELARHADVFYLADCEMSKSELAKLDGVVKGAWAMRHGAYDFGSYSALARDFVGWETLSKYDEVIFANDSAYLVKPLDETFARMDQKPCAWWGLQATKGLISTLAAQPFPVQDDQIDIEDVLCSFLDQFEYDPIYDFHVGSYFLAFRSDVINDKKFQRVINSIQLEKRKLNIILKYEIGITHFLIGHGYEFATFGQTLPKAHPVYSDVAFDLIADGFPLFKRYILAENHYKIPSIAYWKVALTQADSITSISQIEDNYLRTSNADKLYKNFNTIQDGVPPGPPMSHAAFHSYDDVTPKYDHYWGFPVCCYDHTLSDNNRAVFEYVKDDPTIVKIIFTRDRSVRPDGVNVICVPLKSREGQNYLARCRNLFVRHGAKANLEYPVRASHHNIINLWHGIPLKRIGIASLDLKDQRKSRELENSRLRAIISASNVDRLAMTAAYAPKTFEDIWLTGLPRHDFVTKPEGELPEVLRAQLHDIRQLVNGCKLILFCPTFRNDQEDGYYNFTPQQVTRLATWLNENNMIMGIREHPADEAKQYSSQLSGDTFVRVPAGRFADIEMLYREATMLITDYSSCFIDYMLTGKPMVSFAYDFEEYKERERGLFYELEDVFPGPIAQDFEALLNALDVSIEKIGAAPDEVYHAQRKFFIKYTDSQNAARVVQKTKDLYEGSTYFSEALTDHHQKTPKSIVFLYSTASNITNRYRIFALISQMRAIGWTCHAMDINHVATEIISKAEFVSFCRQSISNRTRDLAEFIRGTGGKVIYDTDDLVHDETVFSQSEYFTRDRKLTNKLSLLSKQTAQMMMLADGFTVTTPALLRSVEIFGKPASIVDNSLSRSLLREYAKRPKRLSTDNIHLSYLSGTATHSADFNECRDALRNVLNVRPNVILHVVGQLDVSDLAAEVGESQVKKHGLMPYSAMHAFLRSMDINLAPLSNTVFNDAKSALKVFEAALHSVPTIASPSEPYRNTIEDRKTGYLAATQQEWYDTLLEAVDDPGERLKIGNASLHKIVPLYTADIAAKQLSDFLIGIR